MAHRIDGKEFAANLRKTVAKRVDEFKASTGKQPGLAVVLVGADPASEVYVKSKIKMTEEVGMNSIEHRLPADTSEADLLALVEQLNNDDAVNGILVQLPLPKPLREEPVLATISPDKDVDGLHVINAGRLISGVGVPLIPCTPLGSLMLLKSQLGDLSGMNAVVIGRSNLFGKPMAQLLLRENCTVTTAHSRSRDLDKICAGADILVAAVGRPEMVKGSWVKPGATIIDVGINRIKTDEGKNKLVGDVDYAEAEQVAAALTPVPGGVGPMTIACLLTNTVTAACRQNGLDDPDFS
ncbi:MAG: bifunctional methylenetetrahydrofolate dehydrogenase/methenyltetrahydrofolate cyclohydrolase FolD [Alphaproteobacteria bacterium]